MPHSILDMSRVWSNALVVYAWLGQLCWFGALILISTAMGASHNAVIGQGHPGFIIEPASVLYYTTNDLIGPTPQYIAQLNIKCTISPNNTTLGIATAYAANPDQFIHLPMLLVRPSGSMGSTGVDSPSVSSERNSGDHFNQPYATQTPIHGTSAVTGSQSWLVHVHRLYQNMLLYLFVTTPLGSVRSHPIKPTLMELPDFPHLPDERVSLLIGNTARLVCHLPRTRPSLPTVTFYHNGQRLSPMTDGDRYRLIYIGGDGSGLPWDEQTEKDRRIPIDPLPSAAVLLIQSVRLKDSGEYHCEASLFGRHVTSSQKTVLIVSKPTSSVLARLRYSSDDPELSYLYANLALDQPMLSDSARSSRDQMDAASMVTTSSPRQWSVPIGMNLTLFCLYEGAPIVTTHWYADGPAQSNLKSDEAFGILKLESMTLRDEGTYTCSAQSPGASQAVSRSFQLEIAAEPKLIAKPTNQIAASIGQDVQMTCEYNVAKYVRSNGQQRTGHTLASQAVRIPPGTNVGWLHNGKSILGLVDAGKVTMAAISIRVRNFTEQDAGVYQCWVIDNSGRWSTTTISVIEQADWTSKQVNTDLGMEVMHERTREGLTGHLNCNLTAVLSQSKEARFHGKDPAQLRVLWFRGSQLTEPIDPMSRNRNGGVIKYLTNRVSETSELLSVVNPRRGEDGGMYACRVYEPSSGTILGQMKFDLIIEPNSEEQVEQQTLSRSNPSIPSRSALSRNVQNSSKNSEKNEKELPDSTVGHPKTFGIYKPVFLRLDDFSLTIRVLWDLADSKLATQMTSFTLQYRIRLWMKDQSPPAFQRKTIPASTHRRDGGQMVEGENEEASWSTIIWTNLTTREQSICLTEPQFFKPGNLYSLRVLGLRNNTRLDTTSNAYIFSPWSDVIRFDRLLPYRPQLLSLTSPNSTTLGVDWLSWSDSGTVGSILKLTTTDPAPLVEYMLMHRTLKPLEDSATFQWTQCLVKSGAVSSNSDVSVSVLTDTETRGQAMHSGKQQHTHLLKGLQVNTTYAVAIYARLTLRNDDGTPRRPSTKHIWFTELSETAFERTLSANLPKELDEAFVGLSVESATTPPSDTKSPTSFDETARVLRNQTFPPFRENHVLIVILGSMAGVLLVITVTLIALCLWCHLRGKHAIYNPALESPSKADLVTAQHQSTPNGHTMMPNYMETVVYQPPMDYTLAPLLCSNTQKRPDGLFYTTDRSGQTPWATNPQGLIDQSTLRNNHSSLHWLTSQRGHVMSNGTSPSANPHMTRDWHANPLFPQSSMPGYQDEFGQRRLTMYEAPMQQIANEQRADGRQLSGSFSFTQYQSWQGIPSKLVPMGALPCGAEDSEDMPQNLQNDQSSSIYSHIGSQSTLNELPAKFNPALTAMTTATMGQSSSPSASSYGQNSPLPVNHNPTFIGRDPDNNILVRPIPLHPQASFVHGAPAANQLYSSLLLQPSLYPRTPVSPVLGLPTHSLDPIMGNPMLLNYNLFPDKSIQPLSREGAVSVTFASPIVYPTHSPYPHQQKNNLFYQTLPVRQFPIALNTIGQAAADRSPQSPQLPNGSIRLPDTHPCPWIVGQHGGIQKDIPTQFENSPNPDLVWHTRGVNSTILNHQQDTPNGVVVSGERGQGSDEGVLPVEQNDGLEDVLEAEEGLDRGANDMVERIKTTGIEELEMEDGRSRNLGSSFADSGVDMQLPCGSDILDMYYTSSDQAKDRDRPCPTRDIGADGGGRCPDNGCTPLLSQSDPHPFEPRMKKPKPGNHIQRRGKYQNAQESSKTTNFHRYPPKTNVVHSAMRKKRPFTDVDAETSSPVNKRENTRERLEDERRRIRSNNDDIVLRANPPTDWTLPCLY